MIPTNDRFVVDNQGNRKAVLIEIERYFQLLETAEELAAIRAFDDAKASGDEAILFEQAAQEILERQKAFNHETHE